MTGNSEKREERLDRLHQLRDEFETIAPTDTDYAKYAQNALETLREEGYDVTLTHKGEGSDAGAEARGEVYCPSCGDVVKGDAAFCRHCGAELEPDGK